MTKFTGERASFGRHETFPLRYSWLTKGFHSLLEDPKVFEAEDATVRLGVGKNMVSAIRYWLQATKLVEKRNRGFESTPVGLAVFDYDGYDPYLEDEATIWLVHWLLATNCDQATAWYWFFNCFHKPEFTGQEVSSALMEFTKRELKGRFAATTVKNDAAILLRMYVQSKGNTRTPLEDALDSPLSMLKLIETIPGTKTYQSVLKPRDTLPIGIFGYAVADLFHNTGASEIPIEELMYGKPGFPALGSVFRLTESGLLTKLEQLVDLMPGKFELRETAGIHQLYQTDKTKGLDFLRYHYKRTARGIAA